jgi:septal ring factor EnvC (AmiA/AmiB activator)
MVELSTLEEELSVKQDELDETKANLKQAKKDEQEQYEAMKLRIRFMYEKGNTAMLTSILESKSIADLLNRVEYVNEVYDYDRELLEEYENTKKQVASLTKQQKEVIQALKAKQQEYQVAQADFESTIAQKKGEVGDFDVKLAAARELAAEYQDTINAQNTIIAQENERIERERLERERLERERQERRGGGSRSCSSCCKSQQPGGRQRLVRQWVWKQRQWRRFWRRRPAVRKQRQWRRFWRQWPAARGRRQRERFWRRRPAVRRRHPRSRIQHGHQRERCGQLCTGLCRQPLCMGRQGSEYRS